MKNFNKLIINLLLIIASTQIVNSQNSGPQIITNYKCQGFYFINYCRSIKDGHSTGDMIENKIYIRDQHGEVTNVLKNVVRELAPNYFLCVSDNNNSNNSGVCDLYGNIVLPCKFCLIEYVPNYFITSIKNENDNFMYGLAKVSGDIVLDNIYNRIKLDTPPFLEVENKEIKFYININTGKQLDYRSISMVTNNIFEATDSNNNIIYLNINGDKIAEENLFCSSEGVKIVKGENSMYGYKDKNNNYVQTPRFTKCGLFAYGFSIATLENDNKCVIDKSGKIILDSINCYEAKAVSNNLIEIEDKSYKLRLYSTETNQIILDDINDIKLVDGSNDKNMVFLYDKCNSGSGFIFNGKVITEPKYKGYSSSVNSRGYIFSRSDNDLILNKHGEVIYESDENHVFPLYIEEYFKYIDDGFYVNDFSAHSSLFYQFEGTDINYLRKKYLFTGVSNDLFDKRVDANVLYENGDYDNCEYALGSILSFYKGDRWAITMLGNINLSKYGNKKEAIKCYNLALKQDKNYQFAKDCKKYAKDLLSQERAERWYNICNALSTGLSQASSILQNNTQHTGASNNSVNRIRVAKQKHVCGVCGGEGTVWVDAPTFGIGDSKWCETCKANRSAGHYHQSCRSCGGKGYRVY